jgi:uncharacterized membrane protein YfcA
MWPDLLTLAVANAAVFIIAFMKGAFGGGFAIIGIPLLALVMDPLTAGALLAPLFCVQDAFALRYWRPTTWSRPDVVILVPAILAGMLVGYLTLRDANHSLIAIAIASVTLWFAASWFFSGGQIAPKPRSILRGALGGVTGGITTMVAHSGGPPIAMYLLPLGLPKAVYAGTTSLVFTVSNLAKVGPWLSLVTPSASLWVLMALCVPVSPLGVWAGWHFHERLDQTRLYRACYGLLVVVGLKLLFDGVFGLLVRH